MAAPAATVAAAAAMPSRSARRPRRRSAPQPLVLAFLALCLFATLAGPGARAFDFDARAAEFDCEEGAPAGWSRPKRSWCCGVAGLGCQATAVAGSVFPASVEDPGACTGHEAQRRNCLDLPQCDPCVPVHCEFGAWSSWQGAGPCTGVCTRKRDVVVESNSCGAPCQGAKSETRRCETQVCVRKPIDCVLGAWSEWAGCENELMQKTRERRIEVFPEAGGKECLGGTRETLPCTETFAVDCELSAWGPWTPCSASCGGGWHAQLRRVVRAAALGGRPCEGPLRRTAPCGEEPCGEPQPCRFAAWGEWSSCDAFFEVQRYRSRAVAHRAEFGGAPCLDAVREVAPCPPKPLDVEACRVSPWSDWATCDRRCGGGQTLRKRHVVRPPRNGGPCDQGSLAETRPCGRRPCVPPGLNDCAFSDWSEWSNCSSACGLGDATRSRRVRTPARKGGRACSGPLLESVACAGKSGKCDDRVDCEWDDWEDWGACTRSCGGGTRFRERGIRRQASKFGKACRAKEKSEVGPCNVHGCKVCTDGRWEEWSDWSDCSSSCGSGLRSRHREVARHANSCGKPALGLADEFEACGAGDPCTPSRDCALSAWTDWSDCSSTCYGVVERHRKVKHHASGGGRQCRGQATKEARQCNPGAGEEEEAPDGCWDGPKSCSLSDWSSWTDCSTSCGRGQTSRTRHILTPAKNGGDLCEANLTEAGVCHADGECREVCTDCAWSSWSNWTECASCDDQRFRHRRVEKQPNFCGQQCEAGNAKETSSCRHVCRQPPKHYCGWEPWSSFSNCSARCGPSTQRRSRSLALSKAPPAEADALLFELPGDAHATCNGTQLHIKACHFTSCEPEHVPVDCEFSPWGDWSSPACTQLCERRRKVRTWNDHGGAACNGSLAETRRCEHDCAQAVDCAFSDWSDWSSCNSGESEAPQTFRSRTVEVAAINGGNPCAGNFEETASCTPPPDPTLPCRLDAWSPWSACSSSCGGGLHLRKRSIRDPAQHGGEPCSGKLEEMEKCNTFRCGGPAVPCRLSEWGDWSACEDGATTRHRERRVLQESTDPEEACGGALREVAECSRAVDCEVSLWSEWDECDRSCGGGQRFRHRQVTRGAAGGGRRCPTNLMETEGCHVAPCGLQDCKLGDWSAWTPCSSSCGSGAQSRTRHVRQAPRNGGQGCRARLNETRECQEEPCDIIDCLWGVWSDWSTCTSACGGGQRTRERHIVRAPEVGGRPCEAVDKEQIEACNLRSCDETQCVDGLWAEWREWEPCSASCGESGLTWRTRGFAREANDCGQPVTGLSKEYKRCNTDVPCVKDVDCQFADWSDWTDCSATCYGFVRRSRDVAADRRGAGKSCSGNVDEVVPCKTADDRILCGGGLPLDALISDWSEWGDCSVSCGGGQHNRTRKVVEEPKHGGAIPTKTLAETQACNTDFCPGACVPTDCSWEAWGPWSSCDRCGGETRRVRHVLRHPSCGGEACRAENAEEAARCPRKCHEPSYCAFADWGAWGACSASCGSGVQERTRHLHLVPVPPPGLRLMPDGASGGAPATAADLQAKFQVMLKENHVLETKQWQEMAAAFGCGLLSLLVCAFMRSGSPCSCDRRASATARAVSRPHYWDGEVDEDAAEHVGLVYRI